MFCLSHFLWLSLAYCPIIVKLGDCKHRCRRQKYLHHLFSAPTSLVCLLSNPTQGFSPVKGTSRVGQRYPAGWLSPLSASWIASASGSVSVPSPPPPLTYPPFSVFLFFMFICRRFVDRVCSEWTCLHSHSLTTATVPSVMKSRFGLERVKVRPRVARHWAGLGQRIDRNVRDLARRFVASVPRAQCTLAACYQANLMWWYSLACPASEELKASCDTTWSVLSDKPV